MTTHRLARTLAFVLTAVVATPLTAQVRPGDGAPGLRRNIEQALTNRLRQELGLTSEQTDRVGKVLGESGEARRVLEVEERQLRMALHSQLRPGVAAHADSVSRLIESLLQNRVAYAESFQGEMRQLVPILTPVQRGQFLLLRDQILQRVRELQENRPAVGRPAAEARGRP